MKRIMMVFVAENGCLERHMGVKDIREKGGEMMKQPMDLGKDVGDPRPSPALPIMLTNW